MPCLDAGIVLRTFYPVPKEKNMGNLIRKFSKALLLSLLIVTFTNCHKEKDDKLWLFAAAALSQQPQATLTNTGTGTAGVAPSVLWKSGTERQMLTFESIYLHEVKI